MKFTTFKKVKGENRLTLKHVTPDAIISGMKANTQDNTVKEYREIFLALDKPENWRKYDSLLRVCPVSEYYRTKNGNMMWKSYNGVSVIEIRGTNNALEIEKAKRQAAMMPQVFAAFAGADGYSVIALTIASLPDSQLPKTESDCLLFATKAYALSVHSIQPSLDFPISIKAPALDSSFLQSYDPAPYYNPDALPFVFEQPEEIDIQRLCTTKTNRSPLYDMKPGYESYATFTKVFNAAFSRVLNFGTPLDSNDSDAIIVRVAEECAKVGLPQEETTVRIHHHFHDYDISDVRLTVKNVYELNDSSKRYSAFSKHQIVAYRLREFIKRRYDIRYNEVMQMTEFRERQGLRFMYRELNRREINNIHHEALIEGIEPTFCEVNEYVHSTRIPLYNPIVDYLSKLPKWDGTDHIGMLAKRVPTNNPYWHRLFKQWFLSMVAHWMNADEKHANSTVPILIGDQGYRKSTFCKIILPPELQAYYSDSIDFRSNNEAEHSLKRFLLVNVDEFDQLSERQSAFVKHLFQKQESHKRRMYSETITAQRRYASFIGTTNSESILSDPTGNRRYLCVKVTDVIDTKSHIDYAQLYSQATSLINSGNRYWVDDEDEKLIEETNSGFVVETPLEQLFLSAFDIGVTESEGAEWMRPTEIMTILQALPIFNKRTDCNLYKLGKTLTKLKVAKRSSKKGTEYLVRRIEMVV